MKSLSPWVALFLAVSFASQAPAETGMEKVLRATCRIAQQQMSGTCFLVATGEGEEKRTILVSAAHFFAGANGKDCVIFARVKNADGSYSRREVPFAIGRDGKPLWVKHPHSDVAAMPLTLPAGLDLQPLSLDEIASETWVNEGQLKVTDEVFIPGYPAKLEGNSAGWPVVRKGTIASHPLTPVASTREIMVHSNTFGGDSGAPVVAISSAGAVHVVGLIQGMQRQSDKAVLPFEEHVVHTPLGLAIVVQGPMIQETIALLNEKQNRD